jgi:hypothetical protein
VAVKALRAASGRWTAQVALLVLLVQLFAAGFATASHAGAPQLDAFGNVLCIGGEPGAGQPAGDTSHLHECCTFGCGNAVSALAGPAAAGAPADYPVSRGAVAPEPSTIHAPARPERPGSPRAPPSAI